MDGKDSGPGRKNGSLRAATVKDVAREAGVSIASVSRVINGSDRVAVDTRARILEVISRLKYVPNYGAASLVTRRNKLVGVLLPDLHGEFFAALVRGIEDAARRHGLHILISNASGDDEADARLIATLRGRVGGLLVMAPNLRQELLAKYLPDGLPTVMMNTFCREKKRSMLMIDNYGAAMAAMQHLSRCGRKRIAHIAGPEGNFDADERARGYRDALHLYWPGVSPLIIPGDFLQDSGFDAGRRIAALTPRPDGIFAANDTMAIGAGKALKEAGLDIPEDMALVGFDDIPLASLVSPALTTMRIDIAEFGRRGLERLVHCIDNPDAAYRDMDAINPTLVVRDSCGAGQSAAKASA